MALLSTSFPTKTIAVFVLFTFLFSGCFGNYQYLSLVQQWGPAVLKKYNLPQIPMLEDKLTIHGLWPTNWSDPQPRNCPTTSKGEYFDSGDKISIKLINALHQSWPSYLGPNNMFWHSQWITHGSCSFHMFKQPRYFWLANNIWAQFRLFDVLEQSGIVPIDAKKRPTTTYSRARVLSAIKAFHNVALAVEIVCIEGTNEFLEMKLCLEHDGINYINCTRLGSCGSSFKWLKYSTTKKKKQPICEATTTDTNIKYQKPQYF